MSDDSDSSLTNVPLPLQPPPEDDSDREEEFSPSKIPIPESPHLDDIPIPVSSDRKQFEDEIPLPPDSSKYSPSQATGDDEMLLSPSESYEVSSTAGGDGGGTHAVSSSSSKPVTKVLDRAQAKKRLMAFSAAKMQAVTSSASSVKKSSPLKGVSVFNPSKDKKHSSTTNPLQIEMIKQEDTKLREMIAVNKLLNEKLQAVKSITNNIPKAAPITAVVNPTIISGIGSTDTLNSLVQQPNDSATAGASPVIMKPPSSSSRHLRKRSMSNSPSPDRSHSPHDRRRDSRDRRRRSRDRGGDRDRDGGRYSRDRRDHDRGDRDRRNGRKKRSSSRSKSPSTSRRRGRRSTSQSKSKSPLATKKLRRSKSASPRLSSNSKKAGRDKSKSPARKSKRSVSPSKSPLPTPTPLMKEKDKKLSISRISISPSRSKSPPPLLRKSKLSKSRSRSRSKSKSKSPKKSRKSRSRSKSPKKKDKKEERGRKKSRRSRSKDRDEDKKKKLRNESRERRKEKERLEAEEKALNKEFDKVRKVRMPVDWTEYFKYQYTPEHIKGLHLQAQEEKFRRRRSNSRSESKSPEIPDSEFSKALEKPFKFPASSSSIDLMSGAEYPVFLIQKTVTPPPLTFGVNPHSFAGYYKTRKDILKVEEPEICHAMSEILKGFATDGQKPIDSLEKGKKQQEWFAQNEQTFCPAGGSKGIVISHLYSDEEIDSRNGSPMPTPVKRPDVSPKILKKSSSEEKKSEEDSEPEPDSMDSAPSPLLKKKYEEISVKKPDSRRKRSPSSDNSDTVAVPSQSRSRDRRDREVDRGLSGGKKADTSTSKNKAKPVPVAVAVQMESDEEYLEMETDEFPLEKDVMSPPRPLVPAPAEKAKKDKSKDKEKKAKKQKKKRKKKAKKHEKDESTDEESSDDEQEEPKSKSKHSSKSSAPLVETSTKKSVIEKEPLIEVKGKDMDKSGSKVSKRKRTKGNKHSKNSEESEGSSSSAGIQEATKQLKKRTKLEEPVHRSSSAVDSQKDSKNSKKIIAPLPVPEKVQKAPLKVVKNTKDEEKSKKKKKHHEDKPPTKHKRGKHSKKRSTSSSETSDSDEDSSSSKEASESSNTHSSDNSAKRTKLKKRRSDKKKMSKKDKHKDKDSKKSKKRDKSSSEEVEDDEEEKNQKNKKEPQDQDKRRRKDGDDDKDRPGPGGSASGGGGNNRTGRDRDRGHDRDRGYKDRDYDRKRDSGDRDRDRGRNYGDNSRRRTDLVEDLFTVWEQDFQAQQKSQPLNLEVDEGKEIKTENLNLKYLVPLSFSEPILSVGIGSDTKPKVKIDIEEAAGHDTRNILSQFDDDLLLQSVLKNEDLSTDTLIKMSYVPKSLDVKPKSFEQDFVVASTSSSTSKVTTTRISSSNWSDDSEEELTPNEKREAKVLSADRDSYISISSNLSLGEGSISATSFVTSTGEPSSGYGTDAASPKSKSKSGSSSSDSSDSDSSSDSSSSGSSSSSDSDSSGETGKKAELYDPYEAVMSEIEKLESSTATSTDTTALLSKEVLAELNSSGILPQTSQTGIGPVTDIKSVSKETQDFERKEEGLQSDSLRHPDHLNMGRQRRDRSDSRDRHRHRHRSSPVPSRYIKDRERRHRHHYRDRYGNDRFRHRHRHGHHHSRSTSRSRSRSVSRSRSRSPSPRSHSSGAAIGRHHDHRDRRSRHEYIERIPRDSGSRKYRERSGGPPQENEGDLKDWDDDTRFNSNRKDGQFFDRERGHPYPSEYERDRHMRNRRGRRDWSDYPDDLMYDKRDRKPDGDQYASPPLQSNVADSTISDAELAANNQMGLLHHYPPHSHHDHFEGGKSFPMFQYPMPYPPPPIPHPPEHLGEQFSHDGLEMHEYPQGFDGGSPPRRLSLDERLEREMGIKLDVPKKMPGFATAQSQGPYYQGSQFFPGGGQQYNATGQHNPTAPVVNPAPHAWTGGAPTLTPIQSQPAPQSANPMSVHQQRQQCQILQLGNVIQVVPTEIPNGSFTIHARVEVTQNNGSATAAGATMGRRVVTIKVPVVPFTMPISVPAPIEEVKQSAKELRILRKKKHDKAKLRRRKRHVMSEERAVKRAKEVTSECKMDIEKSASASGNEVAPIKEGISEQNETTQEPTTKVADPDQKEQVGQEPLKNVAKAPEGEVETDSDKQLTSELDLIPKNETNDNDKETLSLAEKEKDLKDDECPTSEKDLGDVEPGAKSTDNPETGPCGKGNVEDKPFVVKLPLPQAGKGILVSVGFRERIIDEIQVKVRKGVKFADGVNPGYGTESSDGEEMRSPPPPSILELEKLKLKKLKIKAAKKKERAKRKLKQKAEQEAIYNQNLHPIPPPPTSPFPFCHPGILYQVCPQYAVLYAQVLAEKGFEIVFQETDQIDEFASIVDSGVITATTPISVTPDPDQPIQSIVGLVLGDKVPKEEQELLAFNDINIVTPDFDPSIHINIDTEMPYHHENLQLNLKQTSSNLIQITDSYYDHTDPPSPYRSSMSMEFDPGPGSDPPTKIPTIDSSPQKLHPSRVLTTPPRVSTLTLPDFSTPPKIIPTRKNEGSPIPILIRRNRSPPPIVFPTNVLAETDMEGNASLL